MTEKELITKIRELRQIKPNQNWVFLTKNRILGEEISEAKEASIISVLRGLFLKPKGLFWGPVLKPVYIGLLALFIIFGFFGFAQNSVPGDYLYPVKRATEKGQTLFASDEEKAHLTLELANRRLEELASIVEENKTKNLAPGIKEFQASVFEAANKFSADNEVVKKVVKMGKKVKELQSLGVVIEEEGLRRLELESFAGVLENLITDLENRNLTTKQEVVLDRMKELFEKGEYSEALELYLRNQ